MTNPGLLEPLFRKFVSPGTHLSARGEN